jgi:cytochrome c peroxidase
MKLRDFLLPGLFLSATVVIGIWLATGTISDVAVSGTVKPAGNVVFRGATDGHQALLPLPPVPDLPADKVALGQRLFFDTRLSHDNSIACVSCHDLAHGGVDHLAASVGIDGKRGSINAPTVFNASLNFVQFWDGRAASLEEQAAGPVHNPLEMGSNWMEAIAKLQRDEGYRRDFDRLYPSGITAEAIVDAIATFERTLLTPNSRFDRYLLGDKSALNALELSGYRRFLDYGCASCHQGAGIGGNMFQTFGVMNDYFAGRKESPADLGRFSVTGAESDRHVFKVPSLRNVAVTAPYFHDASARSLEEAVIVMGRYQLGRELTSDDVKAIVAFLRTLTGQWQGHTLQ